MSEAQIKSCVLLFSGGTDSTCAAALLAEKFAKIYLLTFFEEATKSSPIPIENFKRLQKKYGSEKFELIVISTDRLVRKISYDQYLKRLLKYGFLMLSTPGFSSLSWHLRTIKFCKENEISYAFDGMTKELLHFPGHHPAIRELFSKLYHDHAIQFLSPIIDWPVPPDQRAMDRLIVDRHGFVAADEVQPTQRTTGRFLYEQGILPHPNVKGSHFDQRMQHDCYPFVVFNIFLFWGYFFVKSESQYAASLAKLFSELIDSCKQWLLQDFSKHGFDDGLFEKETKHYEST